MGVCVCVRVPTLDNTIQRPSVYNKKSCNERRKNVTKEKKGKKWYNKNLIKLERMYIGHKHYIDTGFSSDIIKVFVTKRCILESSVCLCACVCLYATTNDTRLRCVSLCFCVSRCKLWKLCKAKKNQYLEIILRGHITDCVSV